MPSTTRLNSRQILSAAAAIVFALTASISRAQSASAHGSIEGTVYNYTNDLPVSMARVAIRGTPRERLTTEDGRFFFDGVPVGEVTLDVSYLGFQSQTITITVSAGQIATHDFQIRREGPTPRAPSATDDDVVLLSKFSVVADREMTAQAIAMNQQRYAASISHILALDELPGQGFENIGDYVRFLPGVSIVEDGESASQLSLGGFPAGMSNISIDGGGVASTGIDDVARAGGRELSLQDVPMMNIERVEVTKVPTPDRPASGLGGSMNLVSKTLLGTRTPRLNYTLTMNLATDDNFSLSGESPQAALPQLRVARKQPSFSINAVVPASKDLVFSVGFSKTWKQLPPGMITENADWNLWENTRFDNGAVIWSGGDQVWPLRFVGDTEPYDRDAPEGTYPGVLKGDYPVALNGGTWMETARITSTEEIQAGVEMRLYRRGTLAIDFNHREVSEEHSTNRIDITYGSANDVNWAYDARVPAGADPATTTGNTEKSSPTGTFQLGQNAPFNWNVSTVTGQLSLRFRHRGSKWNIEGYGSYSHAKRLRTNRGRGYASGYGAGSNPDGVGRFYVLGTGINTGDSILPTLTIATDSNGNQRLPYDGDDYFLNLVRMEEYGLYITDRLEGRLDFERVFSRFLTLKTGGAWTREERDNQRELPTWRMKTRSDSHPMSNVVFDDPRLISYYDLIDESIDTKIGGVPLRWISPVKVWQLTQDHPEYFLHYSDRNLGGAETYRDRANNSKLLREDITAGYLRADIRLLNNRFHAAIGARYERTDVEGHVGIIDNNAVWVRDENGDRIRNPSGGYLQYPIGPELWERTYQVRALKLRKSYDGIYPSVNINFTINPNLVARAAYARTIGRPNVNDIVSGVNLPQINDNDNAYRIRVSNPGLEPWTADSFHLSFDSYHFKGGFGSIGAYRKSVKNFFAIVAIPDSEINDALAGLGVTKSDILAMEQTGGIVVDRRENIGDAELTGFEFTYRQDLLFLPSWLQKTQVWFNYTHINIGGPNAEDFIGFTPDAFSAGINYIRPRFSLRIACAYQGETKKLAPVRTTTSARIAHLFPAGTYDYQAARTRWSITAEYSISRAFTFFLNCSDIFADDIITYRRDAYTPAYAQKAQRRTVASYVSVGVKGTF